MQEAMNQLEEQILFLYASPQGGHKECADALIKTFKAIQSCSVHTMGIDMITFFYPILGSLVAKTYLEIIRYTPQIWNFLYDNREIEGITREIRQLFNLFNAQKLKSLVQDYRPTAYVCTHAIPCGVIAEQKRRKEFSTPLIALVTDYAVHSYWIYPEVDLYIVANQESESSLIERGISKNKIKVCGIPIDPDFRKKTKPQEARKKLGLDPNKMTILIMGGAHGLGPITKVMQEIVSLRPAPQLLIVAGTNKELEKELKVYHKSKGVQIFGFTRQVPLLMDAASCIITKPGGITTSEALAKGLPMVLVNPIPGQEERNANYLLKHKAALQVLEISDFRETIKQLRNEPEKLRHLSEKAKMIASPNAALASMEAIQALLHSTKKTHESVPS